MKGNTWILQIILKIQKEERKFKITHEFTLYSTIVTIWVKYFLVFFVYISIIIIIIFFFFFETEFRSKKSWVGLELPKPRLECNGAISAHRNLRLPR